MKDRAAKHRTELATCPQYSGDRQKQEGACRTGRDFSSPATAAYGVSDLVSSPLGNVGEKHRTKGIVD